MRKTAYFLICLFVIVLDQLSKYLILQKIPNSGIFLYQDKLKFELLYNSNLAFGIQVSPVITYFLILFAICLILYLLIDAHKHKDYISAGIVSIILGGATSNLLDRVGHEGVIDFFSITIYNFTWPSFNFADAVIVLGAIIYIFYNLTNNKLKNKEIKVNK